MAGQQYDIIKAYQAEGTIPAFTIVKHGTTGSAVVAGAAATDKIIGVTTDVPVVSGERVDVVRTGLTPVIYGGTVAVGDLLTSNASGQAIVTTTPGNRYLGVAETAGVANDRGFMLLAPGLI